MGKASRLCVTHHSQHSLSSSLAQPPSWDAVLLCMLASSSQLALRAGNTAAGQHNHRIHCSIDFSPQISRAARPQADSCKETDEALHTQV